MNTKKAVNDTNPSRNTEDRNNPSFALQEIYSDSLKIDIKRVAPQEVSPELEEAQISKFINTVAEMYGLPNSLALFGIALLFLKGACNASAPNNMTVEISDPDGNPVSVSKKDLVYACYSVTRNEYIRRFAEGMAIPISTIAEKNKLMGDLGVRLNNMVIAKGEPCLTPKERAWASSFCQNVENLSTYAGERVPLLLAEDFLKRFSSKKGKKSTKEPFQERPWRKGKESATTPTKGGQANESSKAKNTRGGGKNP